MGLFSFIKEAGEKLFGGKEMEAAAAQAGSNPCAARSPVPPAKPRSKARRSV